MLKTILKRQSWEVSSDVKEKLTLTTYVVNFFRNGWTLILAIGVPILLILIPMFLEGHTGKVRIHHTYTHLHV